MMIAFAKSAGARHVKCHSSITNVMNLAHPRMTRHGKYQKTLYMELRKKEVKKRKENQHSLEYRKKMFLIFLSKFLHRLLSDIALTESMNDRDRDVISME